MASTDPYQWIEVVVGDVSRRGNSIHLNRLPSLISDQFGQVVYRSYFAGRKSFHQHLKQYDTPKQYSGRVYPPRIVFDIDSEAITELGNALTETKDLVRSLQAHDVPESSIFVWFSGRRGFHVEVPPGLWGFEPKVSSPKEVRETLTDFWPSVDEKPLKENGIIRARWSGHEETELFKVPFTTEEVFSLDPDEIKTKARNPQRYHTGRKKAWRIMQNEFEHPGPVLSDLIVEQDHDEITATNDSGINRVEDDPSIKITCMHKLWNRGPEEGRRNQDIHEMVRAWRSQGLGSEQCVAMGWSWVKPHNRLASDPMDKSEVERIVYKVFNNGYTPACDREVYEEFCDPKCIFYDQKNFGPSATALSDEADEYLQRKAEGENAVYNMNEVYPGQNFSMRGGEVKMILGDTGKGKTALTMNWTVKLTDSQKRREKGLEPLRVFFNSPEMGLHAMMDRFLQIQYGLVVNENEQTNQIKDAQAQGWLTKKRVERTMNGIHMSTEPLSTDELYDTLGVVKPDLMVIDPLEDVDVSGGGYDKVADQKKLIKKLQRVGDKTDTAIIIIHHVNKAGMGNDEISLQDGKGASAIPQKADFVFAFEELNDDGRRKLRLLKKRRNQSLNLHLSGDVNTFRFYHDETVDNQLEMTADGAQTDPPADAAAAPDGRGSIPSGSGGDSAPAAEDELALDAGKLKGLEDDKDLR